MSHGDIAVRKRRGVSRIRRRMRRKSKASGQEKGAPGWTRPLIDTVSRQDQASSTEAFLLASAAFEQVLGGFFGGRRALRRTAELDHVLAPGLTLGFVGRRAMLIVTVTRDFGVQADLHLVDAERLDRLVQHDLRALDLAAFGLDGVGDVAAGDRTVELAGFAGLTDQDVGRAVELLAGLAGLGLGLVVAGFDLGALGLRTP